SSIGGAAGGKHTAQPVCGPGRPQGRHGTRAPPEKRRRAPARAGILGPASFPNRSAKPERRAMSDSPAPDPDPNLPLGGLRLQADLIDETRFAEACSLWAARKTVPLADLLIERGWITETDRGHIDFLLARKLHKHGGDVRKTLADAADAGVRDALRGIDDA